MKPGRRCNLVRRVFEGPWKSAKKKQPAPKKQCAMQLCFQLCFQLCLQLCITQLEEQS